MVSLCNLMSFTSEISCRLDFVLDTVHLTTTFVVPWKPQCQTGAASNRIVERIFKEGTEEKSSRRTYNERKKVEFLSNVKAEIIFRRRPLRCFFFAWRKCGGKARTKRRGIKWNGSGIPHSRNFRKHFREHTFELTRFIPSFCSVKLFNSFPRGFQLTRTPPIVSHPTPFFFLVTLSPLQWRPT